MKHVETEFRSIKVTFVWLVMLAWLQPVSAQDGQGHSLEDLQKQWSELQTQFEIKEAAIQSGMGNAQQLQTEYNELIERANTLIPQLLEQALARLDEAPTDSATLRQVMGILVNDAKDNKDQSVLEVGDRLIKLGIKPAWFEVAAKLDRLPISGREIFEELMIRQREATNDDLPRVKLTTNKGEIVVELYEDQAPNTVNNFISLVEAGNFSDIQFHRVIDGSIAQAGQNKGDGTPVPDLGYTIACECDSPDTRRHFTHCISMALAGKDTGSNQFFLTFSRTSRLDGAHTCFGRVISGSETLAKIERTANQFDVPIPNVVPDNIVSAEVLRKRDHDYQPRKLGDPDPAKSSSEDQPPSTPDTTPETGDGELPKLPEQKVEKEDS